MKGSRTSVALCVGALAGLLLTSPVTAQSPGTSSGTSHTATESKTGHVVEGEVTKVDVKKGWIDVKTPDGRMKLHFPPSALQSVKVGDGVSIEMALAPAGTSR